MWWTIAGLIADIIGFGIIAFEWHRTFEYTEEIRHRMAMEEEMMAKEFSMLRYKEAVIRKHLFVAGVGLVVVGFTLQVIGAVTTGQ